jgi:hypothetical protein
MEHRGEIIERAVRNSGIKLTTIAKRLGKTRQWIYLIFENPNVPLDVVLTIGKIIYYDFSNEITSLQNTQKIEENVSPEYKKLDENYWKEKYFALMEEHHALMKKIALLEAKSKK